MSEEELNEIFEKIIEELNLKSNKIRSNAYGVTPESNYSIAIRDEFYKNIGRIEACNMIRSVIREKIDKKRQMEAV